MVLGKYYSVNICSKGKHSHVPACECLFKGGFFVLRENYSTKLCKKCVSKVNELENKWLL